MGRLANDTAVTIIGNITDIELIRERVPAFFYGEVIIEGKLIITKDCVIPWGLHVIGQIEANNFRIDICGDLFNCGTINAFEINVRKNLYNVDNGKINCGFIDVKKHLYNEGCIECVGIKAAKKLYNSGTLNSDNLDVKVYEDIVTPKTIKVKNIRFETLISNEKPTVRRKKKK